MRRRTIVYVLILSLLLIQSAFAQTPEITSGLNYLTSVQSSNGSWSDAASTTDGLPATISVIETFQTLSLTDSPNYTNAQLWIQSQNLNTTDFLAERIHALAVAGTDKDQLLSYIDQLSYAWGGYDDYAVNNFDTIMALQAMKSISYSDTTTIGYALAYLMKSQNSNGGFGFRAGGESSTYITALALETLSSYSATYNVQSSLQKAVAYLLTKQNTDGGFGSSPSTVYETALTYKALAGLITDATVLGNAVNYLTSTQSSGNGSWNNDAYSTALALQALHFAETRPVTPPQTPTTGTVSGKVVDGGANQPLSGVSVTLVSNVAIATLTDGTGSFSLAGIPQGSQQIVFSVNGYATSTVTVSIAGGSLINLGTVSLSAAANTGIIQGTVTDASNGSPISGVAITVTGASTWTATTAANGSFKITGITPGNVTLSAGKSGFTQITGVGTVVSGGTLIFSPALSTTPPTATTGELKGMVIDSSTKSPLSGSTVSASGAKNFAAATDVSGNFVLPAMDSGSYTVAVTSPGYGTQTYTVTIIAGTTTNLGSVALMPNATTGTVQGKVTDASSGSPISGATISITGSSTWSVVTGADGSYKITGIAPGAVTISANMTGYSGVTGTGTIAAGVTLIFSPSLSTTPPVETTGTLKGKVVDNAGQPLAGASVTIVGKTTYTAATSPAGDFSVSTMDVDTYSVTVSATGYQSQSYSVTILAGVTTDMGTIDLLASPATGSISGIVSDTSGSALAGVTVSATGASTWQAVTGNDGTYQIADVTPGSVTVSAAKAGYGEITGTGTVTAGGTLTFSPSLLKLPTTGEVKGTVIDGTTGQPISSAMVSLVTGTNPAVTTATSAAGVFSVNSLSPGNYTMTITAAAYAVQTYTLTIAAGTTTDIGNVGLSPAPTSTTVSGRVTDAGTGSPIAGAEVMVMDTNMSATTDENGSYTLSGIPMLACNLKASSTGYDSLMFILSVISHGTYTVDFPLNPSHAGDLVIASLFTDNPHYAAYSPVSISVNVRNSSSAMISGTVNALIENAQGEVVAYLQATTTDANGAVQNRFDFQPGNTTAVSIPWDTKDLPPGTYTVIAKVITGEAGVGAGTVVIADGTTQFGIDSTQAIASLVITPSPQFTNLGAAEQVSLMAALANRSNVATELVVAYEWRSPSGALLKTGTSTISFTPAESSKSVLLESFPFTVTESGDHPLSVSIVSGPIPASLSGGVVSAAPGIRIEPSQNITPAIVVPDGDKRIRLNIQLKGVEQK